MILLTFSG
jgi:hypothetical protein